MDDVRKAIDALAGKIYCSVLTLGSEHDCVRIDKEDNDGLCLICGKDHDDMIRYREHSGEFHNSNYCICPETGIKIYDYALAEILINSGMGWKVFGVKEEYWYSIKEISL